MSKAAQAYIHSEFWYFINHRVVKIWEDLEDSLVWIISHETSIIWKLGFGQYLIDPWIFSTRWGYAPRFRASSQAIQALIPGLQVLGNDESTLSKLIGQETNRTWVKSFVFPFGNHVSELLRFRGAFEVYVINGSEVKEIYSKFQTKGFPNQQKLAEAIDAYLKNGKIKYSILEFSLSPQFMNFRCMQQARWSPCQLLIRCSHHRNDGFRTTGNLCGLHMTFQTPDWCLCI